MRLRVRCNVWYELDAGAEVPRPRRPPLRNRNVGGYADEAAELTGFDVIFAEVRVIRTLQR